ncbi:hypothetical protein MNB_SM-4-657 [hydrothermal vent metagenome]|uniref:Outer membrane protein beta-barrel domain-containing protein n=1 Tax=hydrothermal vent metagenome TaxID=652676 RepID=A0A1W1CH71_9ZZZZ
MNKALLSLILVLIFSSTLFSRDGVFSLSTAFVGMGMDYREYDDNGAILDSEKSSLNWIIGSEFIFDYTVVYENNNYAQLGVEVLILRGNTEYVGSFIGSNLGYGSLVSTTKNTVSDIAGFYMYTHVFDNGLDLGYGLALGHRSWKRILSASQVEVYYWYSLRPRVKLTYKLGGLSIATLAEYQYGINPKMSATGFSSDFKLGSANIAKLKIPLKYELNEKLGFFVEYVYEHQIIEKSNVQSGFFEPDSTANNQYVKIGAIFKF